MPKSRSPPALNLNSARPGNDNQQSMSPPLLSPPSPTSPYSPRSMPGSPHIPSAYPQTVLDKALDSRDATGTWEPHRTNGNTSPPITAMPEFPASPKRSSPKHGRDPSKSFFSNLMASKSSHKLQPIEINNVENTEKPNPKNRATSRDRNLQPLKTRGSTPDLPRLQQGQEKRSGNASDDQGTGPSGPPVAEITGQAGPNWKPKSRFGGILSRTRSMKLDDPSAVRAEAKKRPSQLNLNAHVIQNCDAQAVVDEPLRTAPIEWDHRQRAFAEDVGSVNRNRSADRKPPVAHDDSVAANRRERVGVPTSTTHPFRDGSTLHILSNIHQTGKGVGDRLGRAGKGFLGKITRSDSSNQREMPTDDTYVLTTINLPLVRQTRKTRIAKRLDLSKDKTEFWMPALPWRCIDYLNMNGCEEEGLYRIPGSGRDVKHWQRRFDTEYDINLFDEPDLYDINTIGSMFKAWLRELPDEIFPRSTQQMIATKCAGALKTPQLLKDELSKLPPFNYYLLFAITCHLSLLHGFSDKNKMDYRNLCICFQPCLKIDGFCFKFLVQDWKTCWQGCWTEKEYLEEEYRYAREGSISGQTTGSDDHSADERAVSSSGSSQHLVPASEPRQPTSTRAKHRKAVSVGTSGHSEPPPNNPNLVRPATTNTASHGAHEPRGGPQGMMSTSAPNRDTLRTLPELKHLSPLKML